MSALRLPLGDILCPGALMTIGAYFAAHPKVDVVIGWNLTFREQDSSTLRQAQGTAGSGSRIVYLYKPLGLHLDYLLYCKYFMPQESVFWRRRVYEQACPDVGRIGELDLDLYLLDHDYFPPRFAVRSIRMALIDAQSATLHRPIGGFRKHNKHCASRTLGVENSQ